MDDIQSYTELFRHLVENVYLHTGNDVTLDGAYVWDGVTIGDGCEVTMSILDDRVYLENKVTLKKGCVLGSGVS